MKNLALVTLSLLLFTSCNAQWGNKIKGNGNITAIERSVGNYDALDMTGFFDVEFIDGQEGALILTGEENLLAYIITEVKDGKLILKTKKGYNLQTSKRAGIKITVPVEEINAVYLSGSGDITSQTTLKGDSFSTTISGSGDITLDLLVLDLKTSISGSGDIDVSGTAERFDVSISGSGDIDAYNLTAKEVSVQISGSGDVDVTATENFKARISGSGDINYRGNPSKVDTKSSGSGAISKVAP